MIYLLPGLGADHRMYGPEWAARSDVQLLDWPPYAGENTLPQLAKRIVAEHDIASGDTIGGSSLGGMVALEIFCELQNTRVILIGSAVSAREINPLLRLLAPLASVTPVRLIQTLAGKNSRSLTSMFADADPEFIRTMCLAFPDWQGFQGRQDRVVRIHGANDHVIRCPADCHIVRGAGHLVAMTHAEDCIRIIKGAGSTGSRTAATRATT